MPDRTPTAATAWRSGGQVQMRRGSHVDTAPGRRRSYPASRDPGGRQHRAERAADRRPSGGARLAAAARPGGSGRGHGTGAHERNTRSPPRAPCPRPESRGGTGRYENETERRMLGSRTGNGSRPGGDNGVHIDDWRSCGTSCGPNNPPCERVEIPPPTILVKQAPRNPFYFRQLPPAGPRLWPLTQIRASVSTLDRRQRVAVCSSRSRGQSTPRGSS